MKLAVQWHAVNRVQVWGAILCVLAAAPFYIFPTPAAWPGLLFLPVAAGTRWFYRRKPLPITPLNLSILLFAVQVLVSSWATYDLALSLPKLSQVVWGIGLFFLAFETSKVWKGWQTSLSFYILCGLLVALLGCVGMQPSTDDASIKFPAISQAISGSPFLLSGMQRLEDGFNPNIIAGTLLWMLLPAFFALFSLFSRFRFFGIIHSRSFLRIFWCFLRFVFLGVCCVAMLLVFILTQSRGAYIGLLLILVPVVILSFPRRSSLYIAALVLGVAIALVILSAPFIPTIYHAVTTAQPGEINPALSTRSFAQRMGYWTYALYTIRDFPLTGVGMNTFRYVVYYLYPIPCSATVCDIHHVHNEFLQAALDLGIPGLIAFIALYLGAFRMLFVLFQKAERGEVPDFPLKLMVLGLGGGLLSHMIFGLFDAVFLVANPGFTFWMLLGLICGLYKQYGPQSVGKVNAN